MFISLMGERILPTQSGHLCSLYMLVSHETAYQESGTEMRERVRLPVDSRMNGHTERYLIS